MYNNAKRQISIWHVSYNYIALHIMLRRNDSWWQNVIYIFHHWIVLAASATNQDALFFNRNSKNSTNIEPSLSLGESRGTCWSKGGRKEGQSPKQKKRSKFKKKKGKEKVNAAEESSSDGKSDGSIAFINSDCAAFIKDSTGATVIIDTSVSSHMTLHQDMLKNYQSFPNQGLFVQLTKAHWMH